MNTIPEILAHLLATLRADLGTFDLSGDDAVKVGTFTHPPNAGPFVCVTPPRKTDSEPFGTGPDFYLETWTAELRGWAPIERGTTEDREARGRRLMAEVQQALDEAHRQPGVYPDNGLRRCVRFQSTESDPNPAANTAKPGFGFGALTLDFTFRRASGTGA